MANGKKSLQILGYGLAEILGLLAVVIGAFLVLNYFNVISLSQLYPKYFGSLPHAPSKPKVILVLPPVLTSIPCPVEKSLCSTGKLISTNSGNLKIHALVYKLPERTELKAVMPGTINEGVESGPINKTHPFIEFIRLGYTKTIATYNFFGTIENPIEGNPSHGFKLYNQGEVIAHIDQSMPKKGDGGTTFITPEILKGENFVFYLIQNDKYYNLRISGDRIILEP